MFPSAYFMLTLSWTLLFNSLPLRCGTLQFKLPKQQLSSVSMFPFKISLQARFFNLNNPLRASFHKTTILIPSPFNPRAWTNALSILFLMDCLLLQYHDGGFLQSHHHFYPQTTFWDFRGAGVAF